MCGMHGIDGFLPVKSSRLLVYTPVGIAQLTGKLKLNFVYFWMFERRVTDSVQAASRLLGMIDAGLVRAGGDRRAMKFRGYKCILRIDAITAKWVLWLQVRRSWIICDIGGDGTWDGGDGAVARCAGNDRRTQIESGRMHSGSILSVYRRDPGGAVERSSKVKMTLNSIQARATDILRRLEPAHGVGGSDYQGRHSQELDSTR
ncbi:hypothetical protein C8R44DRAFT_746438 [Mycena epipterygia]|nr:hypothetical protein C8R44DRAFT_746438 [Mycena epipterygia]